MHTHTLGCYHRNIVEEVAELQSWVSLGEALRYNENIQEEGGITFSAEPSIKDKQRERCLLTPRPLCCPFDSTS